MKRPDSFVPEHRDDGEAEDDRHRAEVGKRVVAGEPGRQVEQRLQVGRPAARDDGRTERELEHEVPADDPGHQLAERRVGERVRAAGHRHGRRELGVAEGREPAGDAGQHEGDDDGRAGVRGGLLAGQHEDAGADDDADAEERQVPGGELLLEPMIRLVGLLDRSLDTLDAEQAHAPIVAVGRSRMQPRRPGGRFSTISVSSVWYS